MNKDNKLEIVKSRDEDYFYIKINDSIDWYDSISILDPMKPNLGNFFITEEEAETAKLQLLAKFDTIHQRVHNYFYIHIIEKIFWEPCEHVQAVDLAMFNMGNYFLTEAEAEAARPEMLTKFDSIHKDASWYFYVEVNGCVYFGPFFDNHVFDLAMINMGNYFSTEEEAEAAKPEMLKKFDAIRQGMKK